MSNSCGSSTELSVLHPQVQHKKASRLAHAGHNVLREKSMRFYILEKITEIVIFVLERALFLGKIRGKMRAIVLKLAQMFSIFVA
jgi:hypothetical protein